MSKISEFIGDRTDTQKLLAAIVAICGAFGVGNYTSSDVECANNLIHGGSGDEAAPQGEPSPATDATGEAD